MTPARPPQHPPSSAWSSMVGSCARSLSKALPLPQVVRELPPHARLDARMSLAVSADDVRELASLLRKIDPQIRDQHGRFAAPRALSQAILQNRQEHLSRLLDAKASPNEKFFILKSNEFDFGGDHLTHRAAALNQPESLRKLIEAGASLSSVNQNGESALIAACRMGSVDTALMLINAGARPDAADFFKRSPLNHALFYRHQFDRLAFKGDPDPESSDRTLERLERGAIIAKALLVAGSGVVNLPPEHNPEGLINNSSLPILAGAIRLNDRELIKRLIESGADTDWLSLTDAPRKQTAAESSSPPSLSLERGWLISLRPHADLAEAIDFAKRVAAQHASSATPSTPANDSVLQATHPAPLVKARSILASRRAAEELRASLPSEKRSPPAA